jgi:hypothetical protein
MFMHLKFCIKISHTIKTFLSTILNLGTVFAGLKLRANLPSGLFNRGKLFVQSILLVGGNPTLGILRANLISTTLVSTNVFSVEKDTFMEVISSSLTR